ncbi:MAG: thioredoxin domain-containing protein, partial [bacterium]
MKRALPFLIIGIVLVIAVVAALYLKRSTSALVTPPAPAHASPTTSNGTTTSNETVTETGANPPHTLGPADAPVTLEEFGDFQCPPCGMLHPVLKTMEKEFGPRLRIIFREFPLV